MGILNKNQNEINIYSFIINNQQKDFGPNYKISIYY